MDSERDSLIISNIISLFGNMEREEKIYNKIIKSLDSDESLILARSIETLAKWGHHDCLEHISPFICHNNQEVKSNAILAVLKLSKEEKDIEKSNKRTC